MRTLTPIICRRRSSFGFGLRSPLLVTQRQGVYIAVCFFNLVLRFAWALSIFGSVQVCHFPTDCHAKRPIGWRRSLLVEVALARSSRFDHHSLPSQGRGAGMFFFEVIEILRRTVWAIFRIEWEVSIGSLRVAPEHNTEHSIVDCYPGYCQSTPHRVRGHPNDREWG